ncbi:amidohydrolase [Occultella aeris]|uniref:Putative hydrolase YxeP n=2 Tax=Occultella aeris TaxID=2761496 RepID=A0A7M4DGF4_9MICO|nr:putative hydrolase YxeP [Occultella aeris]
MMSGPAAHATGGASQTVMANWPTIRPRIEELYRWLHRHPELSNQECRTAQTIAELLQSAGFEVHADVGGTGVVGILANGSGPTVLIRAELDGLPVRETTGLAYASHEVATSDGVEVAVMHACGHDVHMACLLATAELLATRPDLWSGRLVVLFQPAEETGEGARRMLTDGLKGLLGSVDVAFAQHVMALPAGRLYLRAGPVLSGAASVAVTVFGRGGHAAVPQETVDPIVLAAAIIMRLQTIVAREMRPWEFSVLSVGAVHAGVSGNSIPDRATLEINLRSYSSQGRSQLLAAVERIVRAECAASGTPREPLFEYHDTFPVTVNNQEVTDRLGSAFAQSLVRGQVRELSRQAASEDFAALADGLEAPYCYWGLGGVTSSLFRDVDALPPEPVGPIPTNHSPLFAPDPSDTLELGTEALVVAALEWLC